MLKFIGYTFILTGAIALILTGFQFYRMNIQSDELLEEVKTMLAEAKNDYGEGGNPAEITDSSEEENTNGDAIHEEPITEGKLIGVLRIPAIDLEVSIAEGTNPQELKSGVGHEPGSSLPGEGRQVFLAGHNDSTFRRAGELKKGDALVIETRQGTFTYYMYKHDIVHESETDVITPGDSETLVLMTCYPFTGWGSPTERYLIYAKPK